MFGQRLWLQQRFMDFGWSAPMMWTITTNTDIPFQDNGNDCGLFACAFAEHCIYRRPIEFTRLDIPYYRRRIVIDIFEQNWIRNAPKLNLPPLPDLPPDLQWTLSCLCCENMCYLTEWLNVNGMLECKWHFKLNHVSNFFLIVIWDVDRLNDWM